MPGVLPPWLKLVNLVGVAMSLAGDARVFEVVDPADDLLTAFSIGRNMPEPGTVVLK
jgi:hypothetical protein